MCILNKQIVMVTDDCTVNLSIQPLMFHIFSTNYGRNEPLRHCMYLGNLDPSFYLNIT